MAEDEVVETETRLRKRRTKRRSKSRTIRKLLHDLRWLFGGVVLGLPVLAVLIYIASKF